MRIIIIAFCIDIFVCSLGEAISISTGIENYLLENTAGQSLLIQATSFKVAYMKQPINYAFEGSSFLLKSQTGALSVQRKNESFYFSGEWTMNEFSKYFSPFGGLGLGVYRDFVDLRLDSSGSANSSGSSSLSDVSKWYLGSFVSFGLNIIVFKYLYTSLEARVYSRDNIEPSPTLSGLLNIGIVFN